MHTKFLEDWFGHSELIGGIHRQHGDRINLLLFFRNKESRIQIEHISILREEFSRTIPIVRVSEVCTALIFY
jgi:hypothetical protein